MQRRLLNRELGLIHCRQQSRCHRRSFSAVIRLKLSSLFDNAAPTDWMSNVFLGFLANGQLLCSYRSGSGSDGVGFNQDGDEELFANKYQLMLWHVDLKSAKPSANLAVAYDISPLALMRHQPICVTESRHHHGDGGQNGCSIACVSTPVLPHRRILISLPSLSNGCRQCASDLAARRIVTCRRHVWLCQLEEPSASAPAASESFESDRFQMSSSVSDVVSDGRKSVTLPAMSLGALGASRVAFKGDYLITCDSTSFGVIRLIKVGLNDSTSQQSLRKKFPGDRLCRLRLCPCGLAYNYHPDDSLKFYENAFGDKLCDDVYDQLVVEDNLRRRNSANNDDDDHQYTDSEDDQQLSAEGLGLAERQSLNQRLSFTLSGRTFSHSNPIGATLPCDLCLFLKYTQYYPTSSVLNFNQFTPTDLYRAQRLSLNRRSILRDGHSHSPDNEPYPSPCCCDLIGCHFGPLLLADTDRQAGNAFAKLNSDNGEQLLTGLSGIVTCSPCNYLYTDNAYLSYSHRLYTSADSEELPVYDYSDLTGSAHSTAMFYCRRGGAANLEYAAPFNWAFSDNGPATSDGPSNRTSSSSFCHIEELAVSVPAFLRSPPVRRQFVQRFVRFILIDECRLIDTLVIVVETVDDSSQIVINGAASVGKTLKDNTNSGSSSSGSSSSEDNSDYDDNETSTSPPSPKRRRQLPQQKRRWLELWLNLKTGRLKFRRCITSLDQVMPSLTARQSTWAIDNFAMTHHFDSAQSDVQSVTRLASEGGEILLEL